MSRILTKWSVLQQQAAALDDLDANGAVRTEVIASWIDRACRAYLAECPVLEATRRHDDLELRCHPDELPAGALPGRPTSLFVSATATEVWPDAFAVSVRIRPLDGSSEQPLVVRCRVRLEDATGTPAELGNAVRDELIALENAARHYN